VEGAAALVDEIGTDAFHMRLLAERLNTSTATLYRHVTGKDELMAYVVDHVLGEIQPLVGDRTGAAAGRGWRAAATRRALQLREVLDKHPNVLPLLAAQLPIGPNALAIREETIAALVRHGFPHRLAARAHTTLAQYVIGHAIVQPGSPRDDEATALRDYYQGLDAEAYPHTVGAAAYLSEASAEDEFMGGLELILDGIEQARRR